MKVIFKQNIPKYLKYILFDFYKLLFFLIIFEAISTNKSSLFVFLFIIFVYLIYSFRKLLISIELICDENNQQKLLFSFRKFFIFKQDIYQELSNIYYTYKLEKTSRLTWRSVFRIFYLNEKGFEKNYAFDFISEYDIEILIQKLEELGIKKKGL